MAGLFTPMEIKGLSLNNRIVLPPMGTGKATESGEVTDDLLKHYDRFAAAGVGLVIVEHTYVRREGRVNPQQLGIYDDATIPGLQEVSIGHALTVDAIRMGLSDTVAAYQRALGK